jgi:hypothetical protein
VRAAALDWSWTTGALTDAIMSADIMPQVQSMMYFGDRTPGVAPVSPLRIRSMVTTGTLTPSSTGTVTISSGVSTSWLEFIELVPQLTWARSMTYMEPWSFRRQIDALNSTVPPQYIYTVEGDTLYVAPKNTTTIAAAWYQKFAALSSDASTDAIITNAPQLYLFGMIALGCLYTQDDRYPLMRSHFAGAIEALNETDQRQRASGSRTIARPRAIV